MRALVVGVKGIGKNHAAALKEIAEFQLVGLCDRSPEIGSEQSQALGVPCYTDLTKGIKETGAEVVVIATPNDSHAALTIQSAELGVKGIYCEKPMAVHLEDARRMVEVCRRLEVPLAVNHQRRMLPIFVKARELMVNGAIGKPTLIKASCAGDLLSDGTHLIDSLRHLAGDAEAEWVMGQVSGVPKEVDSSQGQGFDAGGGRRFGHIVEEGAMGVIQFAGGLRAEIMTGSLFPEGRFYQDFEIFGDKGRIWRKSDSLQPNLWIQDLSSGGFREVEVPEDPEARLEPLRLFYRMITEGAHHPLNGDSALKDMEIITAIYESARLREKVTLPCTQGIFPLELM
jgi:UDP-N-acetyl-2-amino-2-deoxyglucuronate dehydrogenase